MGFPGEGAGPEGGWVGEEEGGGLPRCGSRAMGGEVVGMQGAQGQGGREGLGPLEVGSHRRGGCGRGGGGDCGGY